MKTKPAYRFPKKFVWGAATSAPQIEGASTADGKGESIWDRFAATPGKVRNGETPAVACDHYHRYRDDVKLMAQLGLRAYRLSVAWPRVMPGGRGAVNEAGLDFYDRLIDTLLEHGIAPFVTLYHWDLPQVLEDAGGWRVRATPEAFRDYAAVVVRRLADRVKRWGTVNEIPCFIGLSYETGIHAPGATEDRTVLNQAYHHALLAHGYGVQAVREHGGDAAKVGLVHNPFNSVPVTETPADIDAARSYWAAANAQILGPVFLGEYPASFLETNGHDLPKMEPGDLATISTPTDFLGVNTYTGNFVRAGGPDGQTPEEAHMPSDFPTGNVPWLKIVPQSIYFAIRFAREVYGAKRFYVTENGFCENDDAASRDADGTILDLTRREYCRSYLMNVHRAIKEGYRVKGYFLWSLMDNFEWAEGYAARFGVVHVDFQTQARTPKLSAKWYAEVIRAGALV